MAVSLPPDKLADIQQLALSLLWTPHVTVCRVMSILGKATFCTNGHSQLCCLCHVIQSDMLHVYHSPTQLFLHVHFSLSSLHQLEWLAHLQQSPIPLQFLLPYVVIATDAMPTHWAFYFQGSGLPLLVSGSWSGSLCRAYIALQELQAVAMMLYNMAFHLYGKLVALHPPQCGDGLSVLGSFASRVTPSPSGGSCSFSPLGPSRGGPTHIFSFYSMPALFHLGNSTTSWGLGVE